MSKQTETKKIKTEWDLSLLYKSINDPQIEKDIVLAERIYSNFEKKYKKTTDYTKSTPALLGALEDYEKLAGFPSWKAYSYLHKMQDLDASNQEVRAKISTLLQRLSKLGNKIIFFDVTISKIPQISQKKFLTDKKLVKYKYFLKKVFEHGAHVLTEPEEKILSLKSLPAHSLWTDSLKKVRERLMVKYKGKTIPLSEVSATIPELSAQKDRVALHTRMMEQYKSIADVAESELNAIVIDKKIDDELRGYQKPYDATIMGYENNRKGVLNLIQTVTDNFHVAHRFYKVKAKMLGLSELYYADRAAKVGSTKKKFSFDDSYQILLNIFGSLDTEFANILKKFVGNGQIDAFPKQGKVGGAYCSSMHQLPTYVLLNHADNLDSLSTFAHEMGHAIHSEFSRTQPVLYEDYSMSTAETASTLFESFVFYDQFEKLSDQEKIIALHDKIQDDIQTIFRQVACFNFENEMHETIRAKGSMTKEEFAELMNKHMASYLGPVMKMREVDGYFFIGWPHIRNFFYVYSYAFGQLTSKVLHKKYIQDKTYIEKIKKFLSLGGSMSPEDIFKSIGVDLTHPNFFKDGISTIEDDIKMLEKLVKINV